MKITRTHIERFHGRRVNPRDEVRVYRNLNKPDGPWYSVMQGGRVVGHSKFLALRDVCFVVQEAGRKRALAEGVKNVHAFVAGTLSYTFLYFAEDSLLQVTHRAGYLPRLGHFFVDLKSGWIDPFGDPETQRFGMKSARFAVLSKDGLSVNEPTIIQ